MRPLRFFLAGFLVSGSKQRACCVGVAAWPRQRLLGQGPPRSSDINDPCERIRKLPQVSYEASELFLVVSIRCGVGGCCEPLAGLVKVWEATRARRALATQPDFVCNGIGFVSFWAPSVLPRGSAVADFLSFEIPPGKLGGFSLP